MSKKSLAILMRARMRGGSAAVPSPLSLPHEQPHAPLSSPHDLTGNSNCAESSGSTANSQRIMAKDVKEWMHTSISIPAGAKESADSILDKFSQGYLTLTMDDRRDLLISLAKGYDVNRARVRDLMAQYLNLEISHGSDHFIGDEDGGASPSLYRMERSLRDALKPTYANFFERLNAQPGGLKLLAVLRADLLALLARSNCGVSYFAWRGGVTYSGLTKMLLHLTPSIASVDSLKVDVENVGSLRALDSYLKKKLITWLSPAALELHQITWDDSASLLEKIVEYEAVHPIRNLIDLKRRLGVGRRCFGYFHPAIPGEPLIFIEVALLKDIASSIQEVLWDDPPIAECKAHCALFYSISSTQPGLSGINLGKFLLKRVINMVKREMPSVQKYATLSPIPGFIQWLNSKLASQLKLAESEAGSSDQLENRQSSTFRENILLSHEEKMILDSIGENDSGKSGIEVMHEMLQSKDWTKSELICTALKSPLMRLCTRYLIKEKKRGKALDSVANFHLQNGAYIERINWMADQSEKGIKQSGGIMVNYVYRLENIKEYAQEYFNSGNIHASPELYQSLEVKDQ